MPRIRLAEHVGLGVIIIWPSGILFANQAGGKFCLQLEVEGVFVPLRNDVIIEGLRLKSPENDLWEFFNGAKYGGTGAADGIDEEDANFIDSVLGKYNLTRCLRVDRARLSESTEAWVHVEVLGDDGIDGDFVGFGPYPRSGVLTWSNSD